MLWLLSWDDDNCQSMFHTWGIYNHALTAVIRQWQQSEHVSYLRDILPCSDRCHETITIVGACFIPKGYITMLWPLSWDDDNCRACFIPKGYITMLWPLSWDNDNCQSMFHTLELYYHGLTVVMRRLQLSEHVSCQRYIIPCSDHCHETMTTVGACFLDEWNITMLCQLSCDMTTVEACFIPKG